MAAPTSAKRLMARMAPSTGVDHPAGLQALQHERTQAAAGLRIDPPLPTLAEEGVSHAGIGQLPAEQGFPLDATADRVGRRPIGPALRKLSERHEG